MARKKQCKTKGCRKGQAEGSEYCESCKMEQADGGNGVSVDPVFAEDHVMKLTDAELDKFNLLRIKMENIVQAIRVNELELDKLAREFRDQQHQKEQLLRQQRAMVEPANNSYLDFVRSLARKYKLDPKHMGIDDETGVLRDLRPQEEAEPG
jgi:hypothetical protein